MKWRHVILILVGPAATISRSEYDPFPRAGDNPVLDLIAFPNPALHAAIEAWYYLAPGVAVLLGGVICLSVWRVWFQPNRGRTDRGTLPAWPVSSGDPAPSIMVGEVHHPVEPRETSHPCWLVIPERGPLYRCPDLRVSWGTWGPLPGIVVSISLPREYPFLKYCSGGTPGGAYLGTRSHEPLTKIPQGVNNVSRWGAVSLLAPRLGDYSPRKH